MEGLKKYVKITSGCTGRICAPRIWDLLEKGYEFFGKRLGIADEDAERDVHKELFEDGGSKRWTTKKTTKTGTFIQPEVDATP